MISLQTTDNWIQISGPHASYPGAQFLVVAVISGGPVAKTHSNIHSIGMLNSNIHSIGMLNSNIHSIGMLNSNNHSIG